MRANLLLIFIFLGFLIGALPTFAADYYWVGSTSSNWGTASNWSTSSGGTGGTVIPGGSDVAIFDGGSLSDCVISTNTNVGEIRVLSGFMDWNTWNPYSIFQNA